MGILKVIKKDTEGNVISEEVIDTAVKPKKAVAEKPKENPVEEKKDEPVKRRKKRKQAGSDSK